MAGFPGMYPKAIYWRFNDCQYGTQANYPLTLKAGKYRLIYTMAAWNGTSNYKAQILSGSTVIASGQTYASAPNAGNSTGTDLSSSTIYSLEFEVEINSNSAATMQKDGKYIENNRIVIVKNGKKYNAAGAILSD